MDLLLELKLDKKQEVLKTELETSKKESYADNETLKEAIKNHEESFRREAKESLIKESAAEVVFYNINKDDPQKSFEQLFRLMKHDPPPLPHFKKLKNGFRAIFPSRTDATNCLVIVKKALALLLHRKSGLNELEKEVSL